MRSCFMAWRQTRSGRLGLPLLRILLCDIESLNRGGDGRVCTTFPADFRFTPTLMFQDNYALLPSGGKRGKTVYGPMIVSVRPVLPRRK